MTVYVIRRKGDTSGLVKIGFTKHMGKRLSQYKTSTPEGIEIVHELPGDLDLEATLHLQFADKRDAGEWFRLTDDEIAAIPGIKASVRADRVVQHIPSPADVNSPDIMHETRFYLNELVKREWRGMGDSAESARDRVMASCDLSASYGYRLWHKYTELKDVSGEAYRCLRLSYAMKLFDEGRLDEAQSQFVFGLVRTYRNIPSLQSRKGFGIDFILDLMRNDWRPDGREKADKKSAQANL